MKWEWAGMGQQSAGGRGEVNTYASTKPVSAAPPPLQVASDKGSQPRLTEQVLAAAPVNCRTVRTSATSMMPP